MDKKYISMPLEELKKRRFQTILDMHQSRPWWERQPYEILNWLKDSKVNFKSVLDVGCGDGRWVPAISDIYPNAVYTGIELNKKHIEDCQKRWPEQKFIFGDFLNEETNYHDLILFGGVFNPKMDKERQHRILEKSQNLKPLYILITFDYTVSGYPPWDGMTNYIEIDSHMVSEGNQDFSQTVMAHLYAETHNGNR